jgi:hypothetical protein
LYHHFLPSPPPLSTCILPEPPQGPTFVGMRSGAPEVPELPSSWGYNWATWPQGDINSGDWPSRLGVGRKASNLILENTCCYEISNKSDLPDKPKSTKGCSANGRRRYYLSHFCIVHFLIFYLTKIHGSVNYPSYMLLFMSMW